MCVCVCVCVCVGGVVRWGGGGGVVRWGGGGVRFFFWGGGGFRVDVNAMLGVGGDVGYGGCEPRVEGIIQGTKRYCTILRKPEDQWSCKRSPDILA